VAAGAVALEVLKNLGVEVYAYTKSIGGVCIREDAASREQIMKSPLYMPDLEASEAAEVLLEQKMKEQDSVGGVVECIVKGLPAGIGEPVFEKLDACLAKAIMSIGAVKGVEIGDGFAVADSFGSQNNDSFYRDGDGRIKKTTNHAGGILGGISDGSDVVLRAAIKPTPSIGQSQKTVNRQGEDMDIAIRGRHDPIIVPRAVVVVEAMTGLCVLDLMMAGMCSRMDYLKKIWT
jgi:chorismate synthase